MYRRVLAALIVALVPTLLAPAAFGGTDDGTTGEPAPTTDAPIQSSDTTLPPVDPPTAPLPVADEPTTTTAPEGEDPTSASAPDSVADPPGQADQAEAAGPQAAGDPNTITVRKAIAPGDPTGQSFSIRLERCTFSIVVCIIWSSESATSLMAGGEHTFDVSAGERYRLVEDVPSGWLLTGVGGANCAEGGDNGATFGPWVDNESRDCTFTNANRRVSITKASDAPGDFDIKLQPCNLWFIVCLDWGTPVSGGPASWSDGTTYEFTSLPSSSLDLYRVVEDFEDGWRLTDVSCSGGLNFPEFADLVLSVKGFAFVLDKHAPSRDCSFTNTINRLDVTKVSVPAGAPRSFDVHVERCDKNIFANCLSGDWTEISGSPFTVIPGEPTTAFTGIPASLFDRFYRIREDDPGDDWTVAVDCEGSFHHEIPIDDGVAFLFPLNKNHAVAADCTITNSTTTGSITINKLTNPAGGVDFGFTLEDLDDPSGNPQPFSLDDNGSRTFSDLFPSSTGGYEIVETALPAGWSLDDLDCGEASTTATTGGVIVDLAAGEAVVCTFTNVNPTAPSITLTKTPNATDVEPGDTITYAYTVTNTGPVTVADLTLVDTPLGPVTLDKTTIGPAGSGTETATGTLTTVVTEDSGPVITNSARVVGFADCNPDLQTCTTATATDAARVSPAAAGTTVEAGALADPFRLEVSADANAAVNIRRPTITRALLARTGAEIRGLVVAALVLIMAGGALVLIRGRRSGRA